MTYEERKLQAIETAAGWDEVHVRELLALFSDLHIYAAHYSNTPGPDDVRDAEEWLEVWYGKLPIDCPCADEWVVILGECPPPLHLGAPDFFWWSVAAHSRIDAFLGGRLSRSESNPHITDLLKSRSPLRDTWMTIMRPGS